MGHFRRIRRTPVVLLAAIAGSCVSHDLTAPQSTAPTRLVFQAQPLDVAAGAVLGPVSVAVLDDEGLVNTAADSVTITLSPNPAGAVLSGTLTVRPVLGVASFADLRIDRPDSGFGLTATSGVSTPATSNHFAVHVTFASVSAGSEFTCGVSTTGVAFCWGLNFAGTIGDSSIVNRTTPTPVRGGLRFSSVSAGVTTTCGITTTGETYCWGDAAFVGNVSASNAGTMPIPVPVGGGIHFTSISPGGAHTCGLVASGAAYCWGSERDGMLGNNDTALFEITPVPVSGGLQFASLSSGPMSSCGITAAGAGYCWGVGTLNPGDDSVGHAPWPIAIVPTPIAPGLVLEQVSRNYFHTCIVDTTSAGHCWGNNTWAELGDGTDTNRTAPVALKAPAPLLRSIGTAIQAFSCGLRTDGRVLCWGAGGPQLGNGNSTGEWAPTEVAGGRTFRTLTVGDEHACGIASTGLVYCWGDNGYGDLGDGTTTPRGSPVLVMQ